MGNFKLEILDLGDTKTERPKQLLRACGGRGPSLPLVVVDGVRIEGMDAIDELNDCGTLGRLLLGLGLY